VPLTAKPILTAAIALGLSGCAPGYQTAAYFGDPTADNRIDLRSLVDPDSMRALGDSTGVSRLVLYYHPGYRAEAETALADVVAMRNTAYELLRSDLLPDMELYLLNVPEQASLYWEQGYDEPRSLKGRTFGTMRLPLPYMSAPSPRTDFYYQPATYVLTHEMVELALINELGDINHEEGSRWFFEGTADYAAQTWQIGQGVERARRDRRAAKVWLWLLGDDLLKWGEHVPDEGAGYYAASTQAVINLMGLLEERGIEEPIPHIIERTGPHRGLPDVIRDMTGRSFHGIFVVSDAEIEPIKTELFHELESDDAAKRNEALDLLQAMSDRLSEGERDRVTAAHAEREG
jgi:hypothetical protein